MEEVTRENIYVKPDEKNLGAVHFQLEVDVKISKLPRSCGVVTFDRKCASWELKIMGNTYQAIRLKIKYILMRARNVEGEDVVKRAVKQMRSMIDGRDKGCEMCQTYLHTNNIVFF